MFERILIIRFSSIGDIVLTSPVIRALRQKFPKSIISMLIKEEFAPLIADCPYLNEVIVFRKGERLSLSRFDLVVDLHCNLRSLWLGFTLRPKKMLVYDKRILKRWVLLNFKINLFHEKANVVEYYFEALKPLGISNDGKGLELWINKADEEKATEFLDKNAAGAKYLIGLAPFANWETKCWPLNNYVELIKNINKNLDCKFIIFDEPGGVAKFGCSVVAISRLNLMAQAALIKRCHYFIGNDTGLMHIADAANVPLITFFGPTVPEFGFAPLGKNAVVLSRDLKCRPCSLHGSSSCPRGTLECLSLITPEEAAKVVLGKISSSSRPPSSAM